MVLCFVSPLKNGLLSGPDRVCFYVYVYVCTCVYL